MLVNVDHCKLLVVVDGNRHDLPQMPALARPADAKETAIVCLSADLLSASLAGALRWQRSGRRSAGFVHQFSHCRKHLCHTPKFFARIDLIVDIPRLWDGIQDAVSNAKELH